jgi:hypothetical protein
MGTNVLEEQTVSRPMLGKDVGYRRVKEGELDYRVWERQTVIWDVEREWSPDEAMGNVGSNEQYSAP